MALINWNGSYSVNIRKIDDQHMKLVQLLNDLHDAMKVGKGKEVLGRILQSLADYTGTHFRDEEQLMKQHNFPGFEEHKKEHNTLMIQVRETIDMHKQGKNILSQEVMSFLKNWLTCHILDMDKKYGPHLNGKGVV